MQTKFTPEQLDDPDTRESNRILRTCVHCGFCTATCPTFVLLGDELDSPRGRIYLIKDMLESGRPATAEVVKHVDRCLSCLSCMTTCPSGVNYMHLVDHARQYIEETYDRPWHGRRCAGCCRWCCRYPARFRAALAGAGAGRPLAGLVPGGHVLGQRLRAMLRLAPGALPPAGRCSAPQVHRAEGTRRGRVALLTGCAQQVLAPSINEATIRLLTRHGRRGGDHPRAGLLRRAEPPHGRPRPGDAPGARQHRRPGAARSTGEGLDGIVINTSGCGTTVKDYGFMFREEPDAAAAAQVAALAMDMTEALQKFAYAPSREKPGLTVAYHSACSLQHGQKITALPKQLLAKAGFAVKEPAEPHLCCGSAGTYNLLQPEIAGKLKARKLHNLNRTGADLIAAGNIGCLTQLGGDALPVVHTVELLDWMAGGPEPAAVGAARRAKAA